MQTLFNAIINMSIAGSIISLIVFLMKPLTSKFFSTAWHYYVKLIIVLLLLIPFSLHFTSLEIKILKDYTYVQEEHKAFMQLSLANKDNTAFYELSEMQNIDYPLPIELLRYFIEKVLSNLQYLWLCGVFIFVSLKLNTYYQFNKVMKRNKTITQGKAYDVLKMCMCEMGIKRNIRLVSNAVVGTPMLMGLLRPTIIIPDIDMDHDELWFIFKHELVHHIRGDLWFKALALAANVLHWFNPVSFILLSSINRLGELSCDEAVVKNLDISARKRYGEIILCTMDRLTTKPFGIYSAMSENKQDIKRRLINMLNFKKQKTSYVFLSMIIAIMISASGVIASATAFTPVKSTYADSTKTELEKAGLANESSVAASDSKQEETVESMVWPAPGGKAVLSAYGNKTHPVTKQTKLHTGIDIEGKKGDSIVAAKKGTVISAEWQSGTGDTVVIDHGGKLTTLYAHCSKILVKAGEEVTAGQEIAEVGTTGLSTGPHLHFEVRINGETKNPLDYVSK